MASSSTQHPPFQPNTPPPLAPTVSLGDGEGDDTSVRLDGLYGGTLGGAATLTEILPPAVAGYEILRELGRGGMGVVYLAHEQALNRLVALKIMGSGSAGTVQDLLRFRAEAEAVASLRHPNIVQIHAIGETGGRPFVSLEYVEGGTLAQQLRGQPMESRNAARILVTLAQTVHYAHRHGIIHRDLKPSNILVAGLEELDESADRRLSDSTKLRLALTRLKVADFGLAKRLDDDSGHTKSGVVVGTPEYMAPEQAAGKTKEIGPAVDVYSLGAILYELLTGRPPHRGILPMDTLLQAIQDEPIRPGRLVPNLAKDVETICLKCLEKDPARRYPSAEALAKDLRAFLSDQPIAARPTSRRERLWRWCKRNRLAAAGLGAAAVFFLLGGAASLAFGALATLRASDAEAARTAERSAKLKAERRYALAQDAVDHLLPLTVQMRASQDINLARKQALELGASLYQGLLAEAPTDRALEAKLIDLRLNLGLVCNELLIADEGYFEFLEAERSFDRLLELEPMNYEYRYQAASARYNRGQSLRLLGRPRQSLALFHEALERWNGMLRDYADPKDVPRTVQSVQLQVAAVCMDEEDAGGAAGALKAAAQPAPNARLESAAEAQRLNAFHRVRWLLQQSRLDLRGRRLAAAEGRLREAIQCHQRAELENSLLRGRPWELANLRTELARACFLSGNFAAAAAEIAEALRLVQESPRSQTAFMMTLAQRVRTLRMRARLEALTDPTAAVAALREALRWAEEMCEPSPAAGLYRLELVRAANDALEAPGAPLASGERDRLQALVAAELLTATGDPDSISVRRERLRLSLAEQTHSRSKRREVDATLLFACQETYFDLRVRLLAAHESWGEAMSSEADALINELRAALAAGDAAAQISLATALTLIGGSQSPPNVGQLQEAVRLLEETARANPECWELRLRLAAALSALDAAAGDKEAGRRAEQALASLPDSVRRGLKGAAR